MQNASECVILQLKLFFGALPPDSHAPPAPRSGPSALNRLSMSQNGEINRWQP